MREFFKKKTLSITVLVIVVMLALFVTYFFLPKIIKRQVAQDDGQETVTDGPPEDLQKTYDKTFDTSESTFGEIAIQTYSQKTQEINDAFVIGAEAYFDDTWNWEERMVLLYVDSVIEQDRVIFADFVLPEGQEYSEFTEVVGDACDPAETVAFSHLNPPQSIIGGDFQLSEKVEPGDWVYAFCTTEDCLEIGPKCYLMDKSTEPAREVEYIGDPDAEIPE